MSSSQGEVLHPRFAAARERERELESATGDQRAPVEPAEREGGATVIPFPDSW